MKVSTLAYVAEPPELYLALPALGEQRFLPGSSPRDQDVEGAVASVKVVYVA